MEKPYRTVDPLSETCSDPTSAGCGPGCCGATPSGQAARWKGVIVAVVLLVAAVLVFRAVLRPEPAGAGGAATATEGAETAGETAAEAAAPPATETRTLQQAPVESAAALDRLASGPAISFVLLPGEDAAAARGASEALASAVAKVRGQGRAAEAHAFPPTAENYLEWVMERGIGAFPAVVVFAPGKKPAVLDGDLTEATFLRAYLRAERVTPSCGGTPSGEPCNCGG